MIPLEQSITGLAGNTRRDNKIAQEIAKCARNFFCLLSLVYIPLFWGSKLLLNFARSWASSLEQSCLLLSAFFWLNKGDNDSYFDTHNDNALKWWPLSCSDSLADKVKRLAFEVAAADRLKNSHQHMVLLKLLMGWRRRRANFILPLIYCFSVFVLFQSMGIRPASFWHQISCCMVWRNQDVTITRINRVVFLHSWDVCLYKTICLHNMPDAIISPHKCVHGMLCVI